MTQTPASPVPSDPSTLRTWFATADWLPGTGRTGLDRRVELARPAPGVVAVRAPSAPSGPYLLFGQEAWRAYLTPHP